MPHRSRTPCTVESGCRIELQPAHIAFSGSSAKRPVDGDSLAERVRGLSLFEEEEVVLAVGLGEVVTGYLAESRAPDLGANDGLIEAVVGAVAVAKLDPAA